MKGLSKNNDFEITLFARDANNDILQKIQDDALLKKFNLIHNNINDGSTKE
ncbi:MAG: hypothetical protein LBH46_00310 [Rickettsiales bacterium]|nr:hypothetical protein [Rickettsiales bacterium]